MIEGAVQRALQTSSRPAVEQSVCNSFHIYNARHAEVKDEVVASEGV
jgi:hypothetical protein